jgi:multiple antibiotic resistance protein
MGILFLLVATAVVMLLSWLILATTDSLIRIFGQIGIKVIARVMGLLLLFVATQFVLDGLKTAGVLQ